LLPGGVPASRLFVSANSPLVTHHSPLSFLESTLMKKPGGGPVSLTKNSAQDINGIGMGSICELHCGHLARSAIIELRSSTLTIPKAG
jgi:hypothetical protein